MELLRFDAGPRRTLNGSSLGEGSLGALPLRVMAFEAVLLLVMLAMIELSAEESLFGRLGELEVGDRPPSDRCEDAGEGIMPLESSEECLSRVLRGASWDRYASLLRKIPLNRES